MSEQMPTSEVLHLAADAIEKRGWTRGGPEGSDDPWGLHGGPVCIEGAIQAASGVGHTPEFYFCPAYEAVIEHLDLHPFPKVGPVMQGLWQWNDSRQRTSAEVIEVLRAAAAVEQAREDTELLAECGR